MADDAPAPVTIDTIRAQYPQYNDMSDGQLAAGLHQKFYSDMPFSRFADKIGYSADADAGKQMAAASVWTESGPDAAMPQTRGPQSQIASDVNAAAQGLVSGTGAVIAGAGRLAQAGTGPSAERVLAAMDMVDQGKARDAYQGLTDTERQQIGAYRGARPDDRTAQRSALQQAIEDYTTPNAVTRTGTAIESAARGMFPVAPENEGIQTGAGRLIGGAVPAIAAGAVGGPLATMAVIGTQAYDGAYQDAVAKGATHEQADDAAGKTALVQVATAAAPVTRLLQRVPMPLRDGLTATLVNLGRHGVEFGTANALGTFATNYVASQTYDPGRPLTQGTGDAALEGTIAGLVIPAVGGAVRTLRTASVGDVMAAPDVDGAIAAAREASALPSPEAQSKAPDWTSFTPSEQPVPAPDFVPPGTPIPEAARMAAWDAARRARLESRPSEIPPTAAVDPLTGNAEPVKPPETPDSAKGPALVPSWGDLFAARPVPEAEPEAAPKSAPAVVPTDQPVAPPVGATLPTEVHTSADAKRIASFYYDRADQVGGTLAPEFANKFIAKAEDVAPQTDEGRLVVGDSPITTLVDRIQGLRDQPISLQGAQEIDEGLGNLIDREFSPKGLTKEGKQLLDLQSTFRNMILGAGPEDVDGGTAGFEALKQGRAAWAQAMKLTDLERIQDRAELTDNPATSIRSGLRVLLSNPTRLRGYSPEEVAALKDAANRGVMGNLLHVFGGRLIPMGLAAHGVASLNPLSLAAAGAAHVGTTALRDAATRLQANRLTNAMDLVGSRVPIPGQPTP